jgi:IclR family pca regulon transcriptional regulator
MPASAIVKINKRPTRPPRRAPGRKDAYLLSLAKGLDVLEALGQHGRALSIADVAALAGLDRAGARRVLLTLEHLGYLAASDGKFRLTSRVLSLGYRYLGALPFWRAAQPVMEQLAAELAETVSITVLDRNDVVFVWRVPGRRLLSFDPHVGSQLPAYLTSAGHVLLGALDPGTFRRYLNAVVLRRYTRHTVAGKAELARLVRLAGRQGWSYVRRQYEDDFFGIAVPIRLGGHVVAALHVGGVFDSDADRRAIADILPRLRVAALKISALGDDVLRAAPSVAATSRRNGTARM